MGLYIKREDVELATKGKIRFAEDGGAHNEERMSYKLLDRLIDEAEADVELALSPRYATPFQGNAGEAFPTLATGVTRTAHRLIRLLCRYRVVQHIMDTDFGRGSAMDGEEFTKNYLRDYNRLTKQLTDKVKDGWGYAYPPLTGLRLAWHNNAADDGFQGMVMVTGQGDGGFPATQINDPSETFWNGALDEGT